MIDDPPPSEPPFNPSYCQAGVFRLRHSFDPEMTWRESNEPPSLSVPCKCGGRLYKRILWANQTQWRSMLLISTPLLLVNLVAFVVALAALFVLCTMVRSISRFE